MNISSLDAEMNQLGYEIQDTGGGDTAYIKELGVNHYAMLTDVSGKSVPKSMMDEIILAVYDTNQDMPQERWKGAFTSTWAFIGYSTHTGNPWECAPQCFVDACRDKPIDGSKYCGAHGKAHAK